MRRYFIVLGDKTTAGGVVIQAEESCRLHGEPLAYHGARIYCHACKTTGRIVGVPPYRPMLLMAKQAALDNDICVCNCKPAPRLIASQNQSSMSFEQDELVKMGVVADADESITASTGFSQFFVVYDKSTGAPVGGFSYGLKTVRGDHHDVVHEDGATFKARSHEAQTVELTYLVQTEIGVRA